MANANELRQQIDLHNLAGKLGLKRPGGRGNYSSPHHDDKTPSLAIKKDGKSFVDYSGGGDASGSCIDLVMYVKSDINSVPEAMRYLHEAYGIEFDKPKVVENTRPTIVEYVVQRCLKEKEKAIDYLTKERGISKEVVDRCLAKKTIGFNSYTSLKRKSGEVGYGGDGVSFIVYESELNKPIAVDTRYLDPKINGGVKSNCQGDKWGQLWFPDPSRLASDEVTTVVIVESPINALTVENYARRGWAAGALMGVKNGGQDWKRLKGKRVLLCLDNDEAFKEGPQFGHRPGQEAAWRIHEELTALNISAQLVDQSAGDWDGVNDINDFAKAHDAECKKIGLSITRLALNRIEPCLIPGLTIDGDQVDQKPWYKRRINLPAHDKKIYWSFRVQEDFTSQIKKKTDDDGNEMFVPDDVCGFRIVSLSQVSVASATATMTGEKDIQPKVVFASVVQTPRHGFTLLRRVMADESLHNIDQWKKFGPIFKPTGFSRLLNIWERATHLGSRDAVNFVGLCWRDGTPVLNEGPDCYFSDPDKQCPYDNLTFPSGPAYTAKTVIQAYQNTFKDNAAAMMLVWALGSQLKIFLGFWPHFMLQADKGEGKSTLCKRLERTIGFTMLSGQSLQTEFRLLTSVSHTSFPVGWEELSARKQEVIDKATSILQESYQYSITRRGGDMTEYLISAPVLLAGEDVPVQTLLQKLVRTDLSGRRGDMLDEDLPRFPVREWIKFLAGFDRKRISEILKETEDYAIEKSCAASDDSSHRIVKNYAAILLSWKLLCEFSGMDVGTGGFVGCCIRDMNLHISETKSQREPWVWIMETILGEIDRGRFESPFKFDEKEGEMCLLIRPLHMMQHISTSNHLKDRWNSLPIKQDRVLKKNLLRAGVVVRENAERRIDRKRVPNLLALSISGLASYGLHPSIPDDAQEVSPA